MTKKKEVAIKKDKTAIQLSAEQQMIQSILTMSQNKDVDADKMEKLLDIQLKMMDRQNKIDFDQALSRVQADMPRITERGEIRNKAGVVVSTYIKYEDIDKEIRPRLKAEGFSLMHTRSDVNGKMVIKTTLKHAGGHEESVEIPLPYDQVNKLKNSVQAAVSTFSYGKRVNVCSLLNIVAEGDDDDGVKACLAVLTDEQVQTIKKKIKEADADKDKFLKFCASETIEDIDGSKYDNIIRILDKKIKEAKKEEVIEDIEILDVEEAPLM